jgi:coenzyme PQQ precursor peptide PqqA
MGAFSPVGAQTGGAIKGTIQMAWTTPTLVEICIGLEINGYLPAEF